MGFQEQFNELKELDAEHEVKTGITRKRDFIADALVDDESVLVMMVNAANKVYGMDELYYKRKIGEHIIQAFTAHMDSVLDEMRQLNEGTVKGPSRKQEQEEWERDFRRENGR